MDSSSYNEPILWSPNASVSRNRFTNVPTGHRAFPHQSYNLYRKYITSSSVCNGACLYSLAFSSPACCTTVGRCPNLRYHRLRQRRKHGKKGKKQPVSVDSWQSVCYHPITIEYGRIPILGSGGANSLGAHFRLHRHRANLLQPAPRQPTSQAFERNVAQLHGPQASTFGSFFPRH
jgi:hypothetical protein